MNSKGFKNKRWLHLVFIMMIGFLTAVVTLSLLWSTAFAAFFTGGAGNCGNFLDAINLAQDEDIVAQMTPARDSGGAVITKNLRISGGWFPEVNCDQNNQEFSQTVDFLGHGFTYQAPFTRTELNHSSSVIVLEDTNDPGFPNLDKLIIEHMILHSTGTPNNGGGINGVISNSAEVLLDNVFFDDNFVRDFGGGLNLIISDTSHLQIEDSLFDFNEADDFNGGGMYIELYDSSLTIENSIFTNNRANHGGAFEIHLFGNSELIIRNSEFEDNSTALVTQSAAGGYIYLEGGSVTIENSKFTTNNTGQNGGGLYIEMVGGTVNINHTSFNGNLADNQTDSKGGGLYAEMDGGSINILGGAFINNTANGSGGGLYVESVGSNDATVRIMGTHFENNSPNDHQFVQSGSGALNTTILDSNRYLPTIQKMADLNFQSAEILSITLDANNDYIVDFETTNFTPSLPGIHVHFFFDTVPPDQAGVPGSGPWILYGGPSPFTQYSFGDRPFGPYGAERMCILVANADHSVRQGTGNCVKLP